MSDSISQVYGKTLSPAERSEILDQCDRVLESSWFRSTLRCSTLLRYIVDGAVHGRAEQLKERMIAVKAFHRNPAYDNNTDPIVRIAAGEVRKRLAHITTTLRTAARFTLNSPSAPTCRVSFPSRRRTGSTLLQYGVADSRPRRSSRPCGSCAARKRRATPRAGIPDSHFEENKKLGFCRYPAPAPRDCWCVVDDALHSASLRIQCLLGPDTFSQERDAHLHRRCSGHARRVCAERPTESACDPLEPWRQRV